MKIASILVFFLFITLSCFSQANNGVFKVYCITEYIDGYVIRAVDTDKKDTLNIVSPKETYSKRHDYERIQVGKTYTFYYQNQIAQMAAVPPESFAVRIKRTVIWKNGDGVKSIPVFASNTKGLWIRKNYRQ
jgi:hypothetical protein